MRRIFAALFLLVFALPASQFARAQSAQSVVEVTDLRVSYHFGEQVSVQAKLNAPAPIQDVSILFRAQGEASTRSDAVPVQADGRINYRYTFAQGPLRPFARVDFWFHVTLQGGEQVDTSPFYFYYNDDRFPWQAAEESNLRVHWYAGDNAFGRQALDAARAGLQKTGAMLSVAPNRPFDIYIYATAADLQTALEIGGQTYVNGHASPDLGVSLVSIASGPEQRLEMERQIPHELAHLLTYQIAGKRYSALPVWLREGIASLAELSANPDHARAISLAMEKQSLIPIAELCGSFPPDASRVFLAYAESASFTRYITNQYGNSGLLKLINNYADGLDCQQGPVNALGKPLNEIERGWLRSAPSGVNQSAVALASLFPYVAILAMMLLIPLVFIVSIWRMPHGGEQEPHDE